MKTPQTKPNRSWRRRNAAALAALGSILLACAGKAKQTCVPEEHEFASVRVLVDAGDKLNPQDDGEPLSVVVRIYQLRHAHGVDALDFEALWQDGGEAVFADAFVAEQELIAYPGQPLALELERAPEVTHLFAMAIFRKPFARSWYHLYELPRFHGHSVCSAQASGKRWPDPCFYLALDEYELSGGHAPPHGFDLQGTPECPPPPLAALP